MPTARPLRDVFTDLVGRDSVDDAAGVLRASGHADLPDGLVAEAVVTYADTAPVEVAEHLAPFVAANSAVPRPDAGEAEEPTWLTALTTAPVVDDAPDPAVALDATALGRDPDHPESHDLTSHDLTSHDLMSHDLTNHDPGSLDFGGGGPDDVSDARREYPADGAGDPTDDHGAMADPVAGLDLPDTGDVAEPPGHSGPLPIDADGVDQHAAGPDDIDGDSYL